MVNGAVRLTSRDRNALVARLRATRLAAAWADEVQHSGAETLEDLLAAAESVVQGRVQGGAARHIAAIAREVFLAFAQDRDKAGTSQAVPVHVRTVTVETKLTPHQVSLARGRGKRLVRRQQRAEALHGHTLEDVDGLLAALALMGEDAVDDPLYRLAKQHVTNGFLLPGEVEDCIRERVREGDLKMVGERALDGYRIVLLKFAVMGLRRGSRDMGYAMIDRWARDGKLSRDHRQLVETLLWEARNDKV